MDKKMFIVKNDEIQNALLNSTRQYLTGKLALPQELNYFEDEKLEIGITSYSDASAEMPHYHTKAHEYQFLVSGVTEYLDLDTGETYRFEQGDFYVTPPGIKYAQRSLPGTTIFFIKSPGGNDKVSIEATQEVKDWMNQQVK
ncbi:cupin domain-containing protein [Cytobacillus gottheilii]|uniref:cupin domain-containing protein n=1 Tax=Cytobacillus gottheilii TaxID=859144 RepID=UPI003CEA714A